MNRTNQILAIVLAAQVVLAAIIFLPRSAADEVESGPLLAEFSPPNVAELTITDADDNAVRIASNDAGEWVLPEADDYPVQLSRVDALLDALQNLEADRLIAQNQSSHNRLGVSQGDFERLVEIRNADDSVDRLYIGSSAGANATHMRINDANEVYLTGGLAAWEVPTQISSWVDPAYFSVTQANIVAVQLENEHGVLDLEQRAGEWTLTDLEDDETFDPASISSLLSQVSSIRMTAPLGMDQEESYGMDDPLAVIILTVEEVVEPEVTDEPTATPEDGVEPEVVEPETVQLTYTLLLGAQLEEDGDYVLISSESAYYVQVPSHAINAYLDLAREDVLVVPEEEATPETEGGEGE